LLSSGAWRGPRDAPLSFVDDADLAALGGLGAVRAHGVEVIVVGDGALARAAVGCGLRCIWRLPFARGESATTRAAAIDDVARLLASGVALEGVLPSPVGEPMGLDTLDLFARCRVALDVPHLLADFARLGHRLAQMSLAFGADQLFGPIVAERALRLGDNAGNPAMTRKEAAMLIRGAGLVPCERLAGQEIQQELQQEIRGEFEERFQDVTR
jgi:hypothetical protein